MPDKYYIDNNNHLRLVPEGKEQKFLARYPGSREATRKELADFEDRRAKMQPSTPRGSNIPDNTGNRSAIFRGNQPMPPVMQQNRPGLIAGTPGLDFKMRGYAVPAQGGLDVVPGITPPQRGKPLSGTVAETMQDMPVSPETYFDMSVDRYRQERDWIEQVKNDSTLSENVKQSLINDYQANTRTSDLTVEDKDLPPAAKEWLERNKVSREVARYNPSAMGGGFYTDTVKENTPEQTAFIKDYIANSEDGKRYAQAHQEFIGQLEGDADILLNRIEGIRETSERNKEAYAKRHHISTWSLKGTNYRNDALLDKAANLLKNTKLLLSANREGDGFTKGLYLTNEDLKELAVLTESFYNDKVLNQVIDKYEQDPGSLSEEENIIIQAKYIADQINAGVDPGGWYNIGQTTKESLPFMRDFILTAPIGGAAAGLVKGGASALAAKTGANLLLSRGIGGTVSNLTKGAIDLSVRPAVQTMFSPSSYAMAFEEMQGQAMNKDAQGNIIFDSRKTQGHGMASAFIENQSEVLGEVALDKLFQKFRIPVPAFLKTNAAKRLSSATGIQGPITEYAEEKYAGLANIVRGEQTIEGFFDPRQNLETFGAVAIMQIPFSAINSTGYGIGKIRDVQAKRAIRQTYDKSAGSLDKYFGEDAQQAVFAFNKLVDSSSEEELRQELLSVIEDERLDDNGKRAIVEYVTAYSAYSGMNKAKQEDVAQVGQQIAQLVDENINPQMNAVVSAVIAGNGNPLQVVGGNIVQREDGSIDREASDKQIFYIDAEGNRQVTSIGFIESIAENIPAQDAIAQLTEMETANVTARQENEEVREYLPGETVTADVSGNGITFTGEVTGITPSGNYIIVSPVTGEQVEAEPRHIINQDNIQGVENGSLVEYRNHKDETVQGTVNDAYGLRPQGMMDIDGNGVPVADIIGLADQLTVNSQQLTPEIDNLQATTPENGDNLQATGQQNKDVAGEEAGNLKAIGQIPEDEKGNLLFEQAPVEATIGALGEVYNDIAELSGVVDATINNIRKQIDKAKAPKPTGDINKDIANKRAANRQLEELNNRLSYWEEVRKAIQESKPVRQQITEQLTGQETPVINNTAAEVSGQENSLEVNTKNENIQPDTKQEISINNEVSQAESGINITPTIETEPLEAENQIILHSISSRKKGDIITDIYSSVQYEITEPEKKGLSTLREIKSGRIQKTNPNDRRYYTDATDAEIRLKRDQPVYLWDIPAWVQFVKRHPFSEISFRDFRNALGREYTDREQTAIEWSFDGTPLLATPEDSDRELIQYYNEKRIELGDRVFTPGNPSVPDEAGTNTEPTGAQDVLPMDGWENNLIKARKYAKDLIDVGLLQPSEELGALWTDREKLVAFIKQSLENNNQEETATPAFGSNNKLVSTERYEELKKRMRDKLNNLNIGIDPELFAIGAEMAVYNIEAGARKFADFAGRMIEDLGVNIRPYLKAFYEGARQMPGMEAIREEMDSFETINTFDLDNLSTFEETNTPNINNDETDSDNRSDNRLAENGGIPTGDADADVPGGTASTQTDDRAQSEQRPAMETEGVEQRGRSGRSTGNNADSIGTGLHSGGTTGDIYSGRKDTGDTGHAGKPLNTNNNRQSREEHVVPRGNIAKINANIAAIRLAKRLIETGGKATPEQMNVLRKYTGWGGLSSIFQTNDKNYKALQDLLTEEEYDSARASATTAFYTPPEITSAVWDMVEKLGFKGGNILEPSAGIGNFFALMPENISNVSRLRGIELDTISGSILKLLYPDADINISGFEKQRIANNSMDLVVSNVPFGNFKVYDSNNKDISNQFDIHDYFIAKSIRTLKAGGIGVFITTSSTLDKSASLRNWVINNGNADFIDAVRLNTDTFRNDAGTEATADIIIVRKRDVNGISPYAKNMQDSVMEREATYTIREKDKWGYNTGEVEKKARMVYNKYFLDNPMRMAGEMKFGFEGGNAIRPTEQRLAPVKAINQQEVINRMIDELPGNIYNTTPAGETPKAVANNGTKEGGLTIIDGQPYIIQYNEAVPVDWNSNKAAGYPKAEVLQDYLDIKQGIDLLLEAEHNNDANIATCRKNLNKVYDNFVKKYGNLNENKKISFLEDDIDFPSVSAIENIEDGKDGEKIITKSDIFSKRVIDNQIEPKADNVEDAVRVSMHQNGKVDIPYIAQLLNKTNEEVQSEIVGKRIGFVNPETGLVEARNQYLSGNVRDKLSIAQQSNQDNEYDSNIEELSKVIPADIPVNLIKLTLGSTWVPTNVYEDFFKETFDVNAQLTKTSTDKYIGKISGKNNARDIQMGMPEASGSTLALNAMNNATTTISMQVWEDGKRKTVTDPLKTAQAAAKQTEIAETFEAWVKQNKKYHEELENIYNNTFNAVVNSTVDVDSFDRFPGVGGKVVSLGSKVLDNGKELHQYRVAKENTGADNELVAKEAKSLGLDYNAETGVYSTTNRGNADTFAKKLNGTAKILRQHQKEGVIRGLESATLLAHEVGTGKTLTLITTAMEMRRLGLAKKPTIIVQRSTYKQFVKEIKNQYPNAKVLAPSAKDLTAKQREQLFAKIAYNDWDIVVLYHSYLDFIPDNPGRVAQYIDEKIQEKMDLLAEMERAKEDGAANAGRMMGALKKEIERLERDRDNTLNPEIEEESDTPIKSKRKRSVKDIEKVRSSAEAKAEKSLDRRTDNTMTFEQLGIDALLIDEAHAYKKLGFVTSLQRVKGIDTAESKRAQSTRLKSSYILENHNGKNVVFATGTPISNTMAEMWTFMRYLYPHTEMGRLQMNNFDAFVNNFGSIEESAEFGSNGKFRITNRFSSYSNVPELIAAWRQVAHTVLTEDVSTLKEGVGTPRVEGGKPADIMLEQTPPLKSVMKAIRNKLEEFDRMTGAQKKENSYIPLVMFGLAKRAAIDVRLVDPDLPDHPDSKLNRTVAEVVQDLKDTQSYKGTIAIFCDSYQSSDRVFNVFREIKQKLVDNGIPAGQVAVINDFDKDDAREKLFASVNKGDVRVIMGTTEKLGVGVNIQERLHMAVHMDAPLRPSDYQQRNGRIMRQGNTHLNMDKTIKILRIGVQKTLDVTGYQRLEIKKKFIDQIMKGDVSQRMLEEADIESTDSSNFNQMMANLSGSQAALALSIEQNKLKKLQNARQYHEDNQVYMAGAVRRAKGIIVGNGQAIGRFEGYKKELNKLFPEGKVTTVSIGKVSANTPEDIEALLNRHITKRVDKEVADLREDFLRNDAIIRTSMSVNGVKVDLVINITRNYDTDTKKTRITREIFYTTPDVKLHNPFMSDPDNILPVFEGRAGANILNVIEDINDLLSGYDIDKAIQKYKLGINKAQRDIDAYEPQTGQPFAKEKELRATEKKVEELSVQMEAELKQIEEAEAKEDVEAIDIDGIVEKNTDYNPEDDIRRQTSSSGNFQNIPAGKFDRLIDRLTQTGLAVEVVLNEYIRSNPALQDAEGNVYGYVTPEGVIYLDATRMNANTPVHEFGHLWNSFIKENNPELWKKGVKLIRQSIYWKRVNNNPAYSPLREDARIDEALAIAIGDKGEAVWNDRQDLSLYARVKAWLYDVWDSIKKTFGFSSNMNIEDMTLEDFTDKAVKELLGGKKIADSKNNNNFGKNNDNDDKRGTQETTASGLDNRQAVGSGAIRELVGRPEIRDGIYKTIEAGNLAGSIGTIREIEEREELESRGINPDWDKKKFRNELEKQAKQNGVLLDKSYLDDKELKHDHQVAATTENDVYLNPDGKTLTKINNLSQVKGADHKRNLKAFIDRLEAHNELFPDVAYNVKGFIKNKQGIISLAMEQPYVDAARNSTQGEIDKYLIDRGFSLEGEGLKYWTNGKYIIEDARPANVLTGKDGNLYFIDTIPHSVAYINSSGNTGSFDPADNDIRFQSVSDIATATNSAMTAEARRQLDGRLKNFRFRIREAWQDRHLAVKEFLDVLRKHGTDIAGYNDYYKQATHINGKIDAGLEHYNEKYQKPLNKATGDLEKAGFSYRDIENYAILKHGLERNKWMKEDAVRRYAERYPDATPQQIGRFEISLPDDFSGITAVEAEVGMHAEGFIAGFEHKAGEERIRHFWKSVKNATLFSIGKQLEGGLIDKKTYDGLAGRYDYYIPLRGHDDETAEDRWDYSPDMGTYFVAPLIRAKGRRTRSESPLAFIFSMAQSAIVSANRNILNQTILRLAQKDKTGMLGVNKAWYMQTGLNEDGLPVYEIQAPAYSGNMEQYRKNIEEFEERMQKLQQQGLAVQNRGKLDIGGLFIKKTQAGQHVVYVSQNGAEYAVYINGNPAVARAINGTNAKDLHKDLRFIAKVSRQMAANFTTRNPIFVATNFSRDYIFASSILPVKEDAKYALQFQRNIPRSAGALQRYIRNKADLSRKADRYVIEYIINGGKTGFSHLVELDAVRRKIEREIKKGNSKSVLRTLLDALEGCNGFAENLSRLSVYITSREQGRSIVQSISDAKEVTVNFNRNGAGGYGAAWFRSLYLFVNAGIQALSNFAKVAQKNKGKTAVLISSYAMSGILMPLFTALTGEDDGLDDYMKLSDWERQNNLCIYTGGGFIKIPLPHELRVFHAMGDNIYQAVSGRKDITETLLDTILGFSDLIPANPAGAVQGSWADMTPDALKPFFQLKANRNYTGGRITNEWADENKPGYLRIRTNKKGEPYAPAFMVKLAELADNATGGDGVEKGIVSFNPDEVNHLIHGYSGGLYATGMQILDMSYKAYDWAETGELKLKVRETPLKTFYTSGSDLMTAGSGLNSKYFKIADDMQETRRKIKGYKEQALKGELTTEEFASKISSFSPDIEKYKRIYPYIKQIKKYESALKELEGEEQKEAERLIAGLKKEVIELNSR